MTSSYGKGVGHVMLLATFATSMVICDGAPLTGHSSLIPRLAHIQEATFFDVGDHMHVNVISHLAI